MGKVSVPRISYYVALLSLAWAQVQPQGSLSRQSSPLLVGGEPRSRGTPSCLVVVPYAQCGGSSCPQGVKWDCLDLPWEPICCSPGFVCRRGIDAYYWQCLPAADNCERRVRAHQQCGGTRNCREANCIDGPWSKTCCSDHHQCRKNTTTQVRANSTAPAGTLWTCLPYNLTQSRSPVNMTRNTTAPREEMKVAGVQNNTNSSSMMPPSPLHPLKTAPLEPRHGREAEDIVMLVTPREPHKELPLNLPPGYRVYANFTLQHDVTHISRSEKGLQAFKDQFAEWLKRMTGDPQHIASVNVFSVAPPFTTVDTIVVYRNTTDLRVIQDYITQLTNYSAFHYTSAGLATKYGPLIAIRFDAWDLNGVTLLDRAPAVALPMPMSKTRGEKALDTQQIVGIALGCGAFVVISFFAVLLFRSYMCPSPTTGKVLNLYSTDRGGPTPDLGGDGPCEYAEGRVTHISFESTGSGRIFVKDNDLEVSPVVPAPVDPELLGVTSHDSSRILAWLAHINNQPEGPYPDLGVGPPGGTPNDLQDYYMHRTPRHSMEGPLEPPRPSIEGPLEPSRHHAHARGPQRFLVVQDSAEITAVRKDSNCHSSLSSDGARLADSPEDSCRTDHSMNSVYSNSVASGISLFMLAKARGHLMASKRPNHKEDQRKQLDVESQKETEGHDPPLEDVKVELEVSRHSSDSGHSTGCLTYVVVTNGDRRELQEGPGPVAERTQSVQEDYVTLRSRYSTTSGISHSGVNLRYDGPLKEGVGDVGSHLSGGIQSDGAATEKPQGDRVETNLA